MISICRGESLYAGYKAKILGLTSFALKITFVLSQDSLACIGSHDQP